MKYIQVIFCLLLMNNLWAQNNYKAEPRSWHNRKPNPGYWQQDIAYKINATINEKEHVIDATEELVYTNNSPHTLDYVFFHLYQNAFTEGSHLHDLWEANNINCEFGPHLKAGDGTRVENLKVDGKIAKTELQNTVMKVYLDKPLVSGASVTFTMNFKTWWDNGTIRRRMQMYDAWGFTHYNGVHWYPRISVFDHKKGWDVDQHLNKELYGDFGTFDVILNFPSNYIVEATGELQNKNEVLPPALWAKIQIKNFANKPWGETPSIVVPYKEGERKSWNFKAKHVHDFAFTGDPSYRIEEKEVYGIKCIGLVQEPHARRWQNAATYVTKIIKTLSDDFGKYEYPKMVAADANDGMEYPMITLDGGGDPDYRGLLVHEIAHNWFYGMLGNNETYRAALDEGFTQFATAWGLQKIDGDTMVAWPDRRPYVQKHHEVSTVWDRNFLTRYTTEVLRGDDKCLNTHSNYFDGAIGHENGYGLVYHKTATMLLNLQYTLGDSLFKSAMQHYVEKWKFCHPYFEDFRAAISEHVGTDMDWFFDQWLETTKNVDYKVVSMRRLGNENYAIKLQRKERMHMPIDLTITAKDGKKYAYYIPNTQWFRKQTTAEVLPTWYGWDNLNPEYEATVNIPSGIRLIEIDTTYRLADITMNNNSLKVRPVFKIRNDKKSFDYGLRQPSDRRRAVVYARPDIWWNPIDGIKLGVHLERNYLNMVNKLEATAWYNTHLLADGKITSTQNRFDYIFNFETPLKKIHKKLVAGTHWRSVDGFNKSNVFAALPLTNKATFRLDITSMYRQLNERYPNYATEWSSFIPGSLLTPTKTNNFVQMTLRQNYDRSKSSGVITFMARSNYPSFVYRKEQFNYAFAQAEWLHRKDIAKLEWRNRIFGRLGTGNSIPNESALMLAGANNEEMMENKYTRTNYFPNQNLSNINFNNFGNLQQGGGLNIRGFAGYIAPEVDNSGNYYLNYKGISGMSINSELEFDKLIKFRPKRTRNWLKLDAYAFGDAGVISRNRYEPLDPFTLRPVSGFSKLRADAGIGTVTTVKHWGRFEKARPLSLRVDFPIYLSSIPANYSYNNFSLRRVIIGVGKSF